MESVIGDARMQGDQALASHAVQHCRVGGVRRRDRGNSSTGQKGEKGGGRKTIANGATVKVLMTAGIDEQLLRKLVR